jgi:hypothetical protein
MTLTPWDKFVIQTAIHRYEKAFPDKPSPSLAEALSGIQIKADVNRVRTYEAWAATVLKVYGQEHLSLF